MVTRMLTLGTVAAVSGIILVATVLQRAVGFGDALLAVPLMTFVVPTKNAIVIAFLVGAVTTTWMLLRFWSHVQWRTTRLLGVGTAAGAPIGVVILSVVSAVALRLSLGLLTCAAAAWIVISSHRSSRTVVPRASHTIAMGVVSGVLNTSLATNGPPLVYELRRTGFENDRFRGTISAAFMISNVIGLPFLALAGLITSFDIKLAAISLAACAVGIALGSWVCARMETAHFIWAADLLLLVTGVITVVSVIKTVW
jgi:uncharacterized membrane protein YfcA